MAVTIVLNRNSINNLRANIEKSAMISMEDVKADMMNTVPLDQGGLQNSIYVDKKHIGNETHIFIDHDCIYARYLYYGLKMVDSETGKGPALIHDENGGIVGYRYRKGAKLIVKQPTEKLTYQNGRTDHWLELYISGNKKDFLLNSFIKNLKREAGV